MGLIQQAASSGSFPYSDGRWREKKAARWEGHSATDGKGTGGGAAEEGRQEQSGVYGVAREKAGGREGETAAQNECLSRRIQCLKD